MSYTAGMLYEAPPYFYIFYSILPNNIFTNEYPNFMPKNTNIIPQTIFIYFIIVLNLSIILYEVNAIMLNQIIDAKHTPIINNYALFSDKPERIPP